MSQLPAQSYGQLFQIEKNLLDGFSAMLGACIGVPIRESMHDGTLEAPYINLELGGVSVLQHTYVFPQTNVPDDQKRQAWDGYGGDLEIEIVTLRANDKLALMHNTMIGEVRAALQMFLLVQTWTKYQQLILITDCRETSPPLHTWDDERKMDTTTMTFSLVTNINPLAWPISQ